MHWAPLPAALALRLEKSTSWQRCWHRRPQLLTAWASSRFTEFLYSRRLGRDAGRFLSKCSMALAPLWRTTSGGLLHSARRHAGWWLTAGAELLFPPACAYCDSGLENVAGNRALCAQCLDLLLDAREFCGKCGTTLPHLWDSTRPCPACKLHPLRLDRVVRLGVYRDELRSAVLRMKRAPEQPLTVAVGRLLVDLREAMLRDPKFDVIVPIPMHWRRRMWRGMNSPEVLASQLARPLGLPVAAHLLWRRRATRSQADLPPSRRLANVRGALAAAEHRDLAGARVLLVDDIMTTGATSSEAARMLRKSGAAYVALAVVARAE